MRRILSKSGYIKGLQCPKYLWTASNRPKSISAPDPATQQRFDQGNLVGQMAKKLFPAGINIPVENFRENLKLTREAFSLRVPLFEPAFSANGLYSRIDILNPAGSGCWDIIEVKSQTNIKEVNLHDVSFQRLACETAGLEINRCFLAIMNKDYVKRGVIEPDKLFMLEDITEDAYEAGIGIYTRAAEMLEVMANPECPELPVGTHCMSPYPCPLMEADCWPGLPQHNVFTLVRGGGKADELYRAGVTDISRLPSGFGLTKRQEIQVRSVVSGTPYVDAEAIRGFLKTLEYPLYFLDFETINPAVPLYDGSRPFQQVPFQYSVHVQPLPGAELEHSSCLADGTHDPRPEIAAVLPGVLGDAGSIIIYYQGFEEGILRTLGQAFPPVSQWVAKAISRMVDLWLPFRNFNYYHPQQLGRSSLKAVLPALTDISYDGMAIGDGQEASLKFLDITFGEVTSDERERIRQELLQYCSLAACPSNSFRQL